VAPASRRSRAFLRRSYYEATGSAANALALEIAIDQFEARAQFDGPGRSINLRAAEHKGCVYLDLAMTSDGRLRPQRMAGGWSTSRRCAFAGRLDCCRSRCRNAADRSMLCLIDQ